MSMWIISRRVILLILLMEYKVLRDFLLHRSSINNSARLSNKFEGFYLSFQVFDISSLLAPSWHHNNSLQNMRLGKPIQNLRQKRSLLKNSFSKTNSCMNWGKVNPTHVITTNEFKNKDKDNEYPGAGIQVFKTRRTQKTTSAVEALWKTILRCYLYLLGTFETVSSRWNGLTCQNAMIMRYHTCLGYSGWKVK
ncbi:hypothetical protein Tco_0367125 [Tanacetum coccineum]